MEINCSHLLCLLFSFLALSSVAVSKIDCGYLIGVKTGSHQYAGTNSTISLIVYTEMGSLTIQNLGQWGTRHVPAAAPPPFQRDVYDVFDGRADCLYDPICSMTLKSDGSGTEPGWYVDFVEVSSRLQSKKFRFDQWLSVNDPPYQLEATRGNCSFPTSPEDLVTSYVS